MNHPLFTFHNGWLIAIWSGIYIFSVWWIRTNVLTVDLYYNSIDTHLDSEKIGAILQMQDRAGLLSYAMVPVGLLLRATLVGLCLQIGLLVTDRKLSFGAIFKVALFGESALVAFAVVKLLWLAFFHSITRLQEMEAFAPLSLYSLPGASALPRWLRYPLQTLNLFEVGYWFLLAAGLRHYLREPLGKMLGLVLGSYGLGLLCWMTGIVFLIVNLS